MEMGRLIGWLARNADGVLAIVVAVVFAFLDLFADVLRDNMVRGATLLVLAALVVGMLQDRARNSGELRHAVDEVRRLSEESRRALLGATDTMAASRVALEELSMARAITGPEVEEALAAARRDTDRWFFKGGTGTYMRAVTLPECVHLARIARRSLTMQLDIIDPSDVRVCERYAHFRTSFTRHLGNPALDGWTPKRTRLESYATVLAACWYAQRLPSLDIEVSLSSTMPTLRWDMSASCLVITQDDPERVNLLVERGKPLYDYYVTELRVSHEQGRPVPLRQAQRLDEEPSVDAARELFERVGLPLPESFSDLDVAAIVSKALHAQNPYRR
ncbi:hypothetical protein [Allostreptomyces psammosilenae]|uniref:Uncharacterized protein n=1 Tax=Allostreptomyces psammosilenae TaxID=1892865 RepID=A0A853ACY5_9ACTN|nr:hypothetical protein [Allostreptomyces psammosilenae]NYI08308.1 hypothetical protein [Allostreptomyces psammosilenae]